jgi:phosphate:Na+ symporter
LNILEIISLIAGGLGLFLYGIKRVGSSLEKYAGNQISEIIKNQTKTKLRGVLTGMVATILLQSSSGTIALTISLTRARLMNFKQAMLIIIGANIGTTLTAFLIGFNIKAISLPIIFVGGIAYMFTQEKRKAYLAQAIFGFGALFLGLDLMSRAMEPLGSIDQFQSLISLLQNNIFLGVMAGTLLTAAIQSSIVIIANLQEIYTSGLLTFAAVVPILLGSNIGTGITGILASLGAGKTAKRATLFIILFNVIGSIVFIFLLYGLWIINPLQYLLDDIFNLNPSLQIAVTHALFNIFTAGLFILFLIPTEKLIKMIITSKKTEDEVEELELLLESSLQGNFEDMLKKGKQGIIIMAESVLDQSRNILEYLNESTEEKIEEIRSLEDTIDTMENDLKIFFQDMFEKEITKENIRKITGYAFSLRDLERIGDLLIQTAENIRDLAGGPVGITRDKENIKSILYICEDMIINTISLLKDMDNRIHKDIEENRKKLSTISKEIFHLYDTQSGKRIISSDLIRMVADIDRIGGHILNILRHIK